MSKAKEKNLMNILYVFSSFKTGGAQKISVETAVGIKKRGHNVYVASPKGKLKKFLLKNEIKWLEVNFTPMRKTIPSFFILFFRFLFIVVKYKIDIIHTINRWSNFICFFVSIFTGSKLIWTDHSILVGKKLLTLYKDKVISVSHSGKKHLVEYFGIPQEKIVVIHNAIPPLSEPNPTQINKLLKEIKVKKGSRIVCTIARLHKQKGHKYLFEAIPTILSQINDVHFILAGDGYLKQSLIDLAIKLKISEYVHFLGERKDIPVILGASDIMVLPSLQEGFSLVILEAFSLGIPCVVTNVGGNNELVVNGETGFVVEAKNSTLLANAIITILSNDEKCKAMGAKAKKLVNRKFKFNQMILKIELVYKNCLKKN